MKPGDKVVMNNKYYVSAENKRRIWTVASEPWMCCASAASNPSGCGYSGTAETSLPKQ